MGNLAPERRDLRVQERHGQGIVPRDTPAIGGDDLLVYDAPAASGSREHAELA
jgi:hypothetical protein